MYASIAQVPLQAYVTHMYAYVRTHIPRSHMHMHTSTTPRAHMRMHMSTILAQVSLVGVLWFGCNLVINGHLDIGELTSFLLLAIYTIASLGGLLNLFSAVMSALGISRRIFELLDTTPKLHLTGGTTLVELRGQIMMEDVHFAYPSRPTVQVLNGVSLEVACTYTCITCMHAYSCTCMHAVHPCMHAVREYACADCMHPCTHPCIHMHAGGGRPDPRPLRRVRLGQVISDRPPREMVRLRGR